MRSIFCDFEVNSGRPHIQMLLVLFRLAQASRVSKGVVGRFVKPFLTLAYRLPALFMYGIDIPTSTIVGPRLRVHHGIGLVVNSNSVLGSDVSLRQGVTIGNKAGGNAPVICDGVEIGPGALVIGDVTLGQSAQVGAGAVVVKNVPPGAVVAGNPAREIKKREAIQD